jgi:hypothetical protein
MIPAYVNSLKASVEAGSTFFAIYITYIIIVKGLLRRLNIKGELERAVGSFVIFMIAISMIWAIAPRLPPLLTPPSMGDLMVNYAVFASIIAGIEVIIRIAPDILTIIASIFGTPLAGEVTNEVVKQVLNRLDVLLNAVKALGGVIYFIGLLVSIYRALLIVWPISPLLIALGLAKPNKPVSTLLLGIGLMILVGTPLVGELATGLYNIAYTFIPQLLPPCTGLGAVGFVYNSPYHPAFIATSQGSFMTNFTGSQLNLGGVELLPEWTCGGGIQVEGVVWDWLVLKPSVYFYPVNNLLTFLYILHLVPYLRGVVEVTATLQVPHVSDLTLIQNSTGAYGAWGVYEVAKEWANSTYQRINDTTVIVRNMSVLFWAWVGGVGGNCSIGINRTNLANATSINPQSPLTPPPYPLSTLGTNTFPPTAPVGYMQVIANATAFNKTCLIAFKPGTRWSGDTQFPDVGPFQWAVSAPLTLVEGVGQLVDFVEGSYMLIGVLIAGSIILSSLLLPSLDTLTAWIGAFMVGLFMPLAKALRYLLT